MHTKFLKVVLPKTRKLKERSTENISSNDEEEKKNMMIYEAI